MCRLAELGKGCISENCDYCIARRTDAEYAALEDQRRNLEYELETTKILMRKRAMEMKKEVRTCANG